MSISAMKGCKKVVKKFEKQGKMIRGQAKKQGMMVISNRARLFIDGRPKRRWGLPMQNQKYLSLENTACATMRLWQSLPVLGSRPA